MDYELPLTNNILMVAQSCGSLYVCWHNHFATAILFQKLSCSNVVIEQLVDDLWQNMDWTFSLAL
jgi:hypothetical protein